ncbi:hypothetical protein [Haladaptatus sp. NG-SE-30]
MDDPVGTDRRALADGEISVPPLTIGHAVRNDDELSQLVAAFR